MKHAWMTLFLMGTACSGPLKMNSDWTEQPVVVDGRHDEWEPGLAFIEDQKILFGVRHDSEYLYLCFAPVDHSVAMPILMQGLTVWFDPKGGKKKVLGVKFPLGPEGGMMFPGGMGEDRRKGKPMDDDFDKKMQERLQEYEVLGPGKYDRRRFQVGEDRHLDVRLGVNHKGLVYELKIPLHSGGDKNYSIDPSSDGWVGIGLEGAEMKMERLSGQGMSMGSGGGMPGGRPPGGGMGPGGRSEMKRIQWWAKVQITPSL